ncbi:transposase [Chryseobacterium sp. GVT01B]|uniref:transposase n=1 Tax=Chryseobacterium sp. GVT01B TaxID=2862675 RepID=UPI0021D46B12|nr:transposase [Chryseobacterium sp. GVT01B]
MNIDFKNINIGNLIEKRVTECQIEMDRICNFFKCDEQEITRIYKEKELPTDHLLKWSKLLEYDFFRLYSQHLIFYSPTNRIGKKKSQKLPSFRKNIYTKELIAFVLERINQKIMKPQEVIEIYKIPKTTLYKWLSKYNM